MTCNDTLIFSNDTLIFSSNCSSISVDRVHVLALVRGTVGVVCFLLCLATFLYELVYIFCKKNSTTLQRLFVYLTFSNLLYSAALSLHSYDQQVQCNVCKAIGFFDQYTGSVQLLLTLGIAVKLFHKVFSVCPQRRKDFTQGCFFSRRHFLLEALFVVVCFVLPCTVIWFPFMIDGPGGYEGPWCWIEMLEDDCTINNQGFLEQMSLWYIPYAAVSLLSLLSIAAVIGFLIYICLCHHNKNRKKVMVAIMDMLLLMPFLVVFCCVGVVEISIVLLLRKHALEGHLNNYTMWMFYAVITPISGVIIPIAFFIYFVRKKSHAAQFKLQQVSRALATVRDSDRLSVNSHTSQPSSYRIVTWAGKCLAILRLSFSKPLVKVNELNMEVSICNTIITPDSVVCVCNTIDQFFLAFLDHSPML